MPGLRVPVSRDASRVMVGGVPLAGMDSAASERLYLACRSSDPRVRDAALVDLGGLLHRVAWRQAGDDPHWQSLAEDCAQEALMVIWRQLEAGRGPDHPDRFVAWAAVIAVNKVREAIRRLDPHPTMRRAKRVARSQLVSLDAPEHDGRSAAQSLADVDADTGRAAEITELRGLVAEIADSLAVSEQSRFVLIKGFIEGWDDDDLARELGTTRANIHVIRSRDLAKLRADRLWFDRVKALYEP